MKVVILAGGYGSRLGEYTSEIPKPMVSIGGKPILLHIMQHFGSYGFQEFYLALGYKSEVIKKYFLNYHVLNSNFTVNLSNGELSNIEEKEDWKVSLIDTGKNTMTGGRLKRLKPFVGNKTFLMTYGDGISDINLNELVDFHKSHGKMVTITAVHPAARFGELEIEKNIVKKFSEKPQTINGWINGGYFIMEPEFFDFIENDSTVLEKDPLEKIAEIGELMSFKHEGFWQCMDTKRDKDLLEHLIKKRQTPWMRNKKY